jgi:MFS family permease
VIGVLLSFVFRDRPSDNAPRYDSHLTKEESRHNDLNEGIGLKEALKTWKFWCVGISQFLQMGAINAVTIHQIPYLTSLGMDRNKAALAVTIFSIVGIVSRLLYGVLADIFPKKTILILSNVITTMSLLIFGFMDGSSFAIVALFAVIYGIGASGITPMRAPVLREYFGVKHFGALYGVICLLSTIGGVITGPLTGWVYDTRGTYNPIWFIFAGCTSIAAVFLLFLPQSKSVKVSVGVSN